MNFSSYCSQIYCLALQCFTKSFDVYIDSHFIFTFTFWDRGIFWPHFVHTWYLLFFLHCSQIYCLALQLLPSLLMFTLNSHFIFTFTFWVPCWSGWINIKSFSFPSDQLIEFSRLEDVGCLECLYQMHRLVYTSHQ